MIGWDFSVTRHSACKGSFCECSGFSATSLCSRNRRKMVQAFNGDFASEVCVCTCRLFVKIGCCPSASVPASA